MSMQGIVVWWLIQLAAMVLQMLQQIPHRLPFRKSVYNPPCEQRLWPLVVHRCRRSRMDHLQEHFERLRGRSVIADFQSQRNLQR